MDEWIVLMENRSIWKTSVATPATYKRAQETGAWKSKAQNSRYRNDHICEKKKIQTCSWLFYVHKYLEDNTEKYVNGGVILGNAKWRRRDLLSTFTLQHFFWIILTNNMEQLLLLKLINQQWKPIKSFPGHSDHQQFQGPSH